MYGTWTPDHQRMLKEFIDERFELASRLKKANKDAVRYRELYNGTVEKYNREKYYNEEVRNKFNEVDKLVRTVLPTIVDSGLRRSL
jgi:hypothetical protein